MRENKFASVRKVTYNIAFMAALPYCASFAIAQTPGTFSATGSMTTPRSEHTATLLADGKVLLTGGSFFAPAVPGTGSILASAEVYDPATGAFSTTGSMTTARASHTATLLPDGRVLIAGGYRAGNTSLSSAELYDPTRGAFTPTGSMINPRAGHAAILLASGKVLMVGGYGIFGQTLADAELYDPATGTFGATGEYLIEGACDAGAPAVPLADGTVLFAQQDVSQVYNPITGAFKLAGGPADCLSAAAPLANGKVLFAGGESESEIDSTHAKLYDPSTGMFASTGSMAWHRFEHTLTPLPDGTALAAGGESSTCSGIICTFAGTLSNAELYDPSTGTFAPTGDMTARREAHTATVLKDGRVLLAGGISYGGIGIFFGTTSGAELYCPASVNCPSDPRQRAITAMKTAAGTDSLNFYQWAWYWQTLPAFSGAPAGFGVPGSISTEIMQQIIAAGGGNPQANVSAEQWVSYYRSYATVVRGVVNAASHLGGPVAPGEFVVFSGTGLGPAQIVAAAPDSSGVYPSQLAGTTVQVNGGSVPLIYTSATEVGAVLPDALAGATADITLTYQGQTSASFPVALAPAAPGIFTVDSSGQGHAASVTQNGSINTAAHWEGDVVTLFATGLGEDTTGVTIHGFNLPITPISVGKGPIPGMMQIKEQILHGQDCDTPVTLQVGNASSQPGVTIAVDLCI